MSPLRPTLLAAAALLALSACHRDAPSDDSTAPPAANAPPAAPAPAPAVAPTPVKTAATVPASERRRTLREEKDGEAQVDHVPEYEGAHGAATALPSQGDDAPATSSDTPASASPQPQPPGQTQG